MLPDAEVMANTRVVGHIPIPQEVPRPDMGTKDYTMPPAGIPQWPGASRCRVRCTAFRTHVEAALLITASIWSGKYSAAVYILSTTVADDRGTSKRALYFCDVAGVAILGATGNDTIVSLNKSPCSST